MVQPFFKELYWRIQSSGRLRQQKNKNLFSANRGRATLMAKMLNPIILALDVSDQDQALELVRKLHRLVSLFKVGSELFTTAGPDIVRDIQAAGADVFLDLKFHDIPNTVSKAAAAAARLRVKMLTVHCSGGMAMLREAQLSAARTAQDGAFEPPLVLGVTVLTSMDESELHQTGISSTVADQVRCLADLAIKAGLGGLVCSPRELPLLKSHVPAGFRLVTPGIRGPGDPVGDQRRTLTASEAIAAGADWLVIGRPIASAADPAQAAQRILDSLSGRP